MVSRGQTLQVSVAGIECQTIVSQHEEKCEIFLRLLALQPKVSTALLDREAKLKRETGRTDGGEGHRKVTSFLQSRPHTFSFPQPDRGTRVSLPVITPPQRLQLVGFLLPNTVIG